MAILTETRGNLGRITLKSDPDFADGLRATTVRHVQPFDGIRELDLSA